MMDIPPVERNLNFPCPHCGNTIVYNVETLLPTVTCTHCASEITISEDIMKVAVGFRLNTQTTSTANHH